MRRGEELRDHRWQIPQELFDGHWVIVGLAGALTTRKDRIVGRGVT